MTPQPLQLARVDGLRGEAGTGPAVLGRGALQAAQRLQLLAFGSREASDELDDARVARRLRGRRAGTARARRWRSGSSGPAPEGQAGTSAPPTSATSPPGGGGDRHARPAGVGREQRDDADDGAAAFPAPGQLLAVALEPAPPGRLAAPQVGGIRAARERPRPRSSAAPLRAPRRSARAPTPAPSSGLRAPGRSAAPAGQAPRGEQGERAADPVAGFRCLGEHPPGPGDPEGEMDVGGLLAAGVAPGRGGEGGAQVSGRLGARERRPGQSRGSPARTGARQRARAGTRAGPRCWRARTSPRATRTAPTPAGGSQPARSRSRRSRVEAIARWAAATSPARSAARP